MQVSLEGLRIRPAMLHVHHNAVGPRPVQSEVHRAGTILGRGGYYFTDIDSGLVQKGMLSLTLEIL